MACALWLSLASRPARVEVAHPGPSPVLPAALALDTPVALCPLACVESKHPRPGSLTEVCRDRAGAAVKERRDLTGCRGAWNPLPP